MSADTKMIHPIGRLKAGSRKFSQAAKSELLVGLTKPTRASLTAGIITKPSPAMDVKRPPRGTELMMVFFVLDTNHQQTNIITTTHEPTPPIAAWSAVLSRRER